ncbi:MAG: hypothetical protein COA57_12220 [Flavobacteriales bacterium]|nr:MAG: hypothetical protein COA57_12220 [Flavobacteriales bacterium]
MGCVPKKQQEQEKAEKIPQTPTTYDFSLEDLDWMLGTWRGQKKEYIVIEKWEKTGIEEFSGASLWIKDGDTTEAEKLKILKRNENIYYTADVPMNDSIIYFKLIVLHPNQAIFKNAEHDWPQTITYVHNEQDLLYVRADGRVNRKKIYEDFFFERVKEQ